MLQGSTKYLNLDKICESGQVLYGWEKIGEGEYIITSGTHRAHAKDLGDTYTIDCSESDDEYFSHYFDLETDYEMIESRVTNDDKYLMAALENGRGIRILNQDLWETVCSFIVSQNNNIPRIQNSMKKLKADDEFFPVPSRLLELKERIAAAGLGYRDNYILKLITELENGSRKLVFSEELDKAYAELIDVTGIGPKVANCILLFGLHHMECCPIDTWMKKVFANHYGGKIPDWARDKYAGYYQQVTFFYERNSDVKGK